MDLFTKPTLRGRITPRDYQAEDHDESFRLWDSGMVGTLTRAATGLGKTLMACIKADTWLARGEDRRVMIVSYETQLVWQFAQEVEDYLGITPGIEMDDQSVNAGAIPLITVVSRQSLLRHNGPTPAQIEELASHGITALGALTEKRAKRYLKHLKDGGSVDDIYDDLQMIAEAPEAAGGSWSRLHKFDWRFKWLVIFDEAHRHTYKMASVGHVVDWFDQNPDSRRTGLTATPKRGDGVSIGDKMFPGISLDYPLFALRKRCAVKDGWAVPYVQKYIEVEGVDFKNIKRVSSGDFDDGALELALNTERTLAKLVTPLLDCVGSRKTLIFSPGVEMAKNVAHFINARVEAKCPCGSVKWYPRLLVGDGAACSCGNMISADMILRDTPQARQLDGTSHPHLRKEVYRGHQEGEFQFLSVCGLCREGYNDPDISCVAIFRPVSKKASSLAEQMKGRSCRPARSIARKLGDLPDAEARLRMIAESEKPNALIIDLVGITGLADCASTVEIYADGLPDEVKRRAEEELAAADEEVNVEELIERVQQEVDEEKEAAKREREERERRAREEAERRAKADAQVKYTTHEMGTGSNVDPLMATDKQLRFISMLGMSITATITKKQAGRIISQLKMREPLELIAMTNRIGTEEWHPTGPSIAQSGLLRRLKINPDLAKTGYDASQLIEASKEPERYAARKIKDIQECRSSADLDGIGKDIALVRSVLPKELLAQVIQAGQQRRSIYRQSA